MTYVPKKEPWSHQKNALSRMEGRKYFGLLMAMRTGKTKTILDDFGRLWDAGEIDDLLVVAPAGVYRTWVKAIEEHVGEPLSKQMIIKVWSSGKDSGDHKNMKWKSFLNYNGSTHDFTEGSQKSRSIAKCLLVNVEALSSVKRARELVLSFCLQRRVYAVIDESTCVKNPTSKRSKFLVDVIGPSCSYRRILTGLVAPKDPSDVFNQFQFLQPGCLGFSNFYSFQARYAVMSKGYGRGSKPGTTQQFIKINGWRDQDELRDRIAKHSYRVRLNDCYDLPPKIYETREVELTDEQERIYGELQRYATTQLSESVYVTALQACTMALRLHQVLCGHVGDEEGIRREVETNRIQALLDILEEMGDEGKVIIWCAYDQDIKNVCNAILEKYKNQETYRNSVARFWGGNRSSRESEEYLFLTDPRYRFMVATAAAGGRGRTWTVADAVIYFSNSQDLEHREQSEERAQGIDKVKSVLYVDLVSRHQDGRDTIDRAYLESLRRKISMAALLQGDKWKEWVI